MVENNMVIENNKLENNIVKKNIDTLVVSGGGVKGISFIGVFKYLEEISCDIKKDESNTKEDKNSDVNISEFIKIDIKKIYAISVGSIISFLYAIGYTAKEMEDEIMLRDLQKLQNVKFRTFVKNYGLDSGKNIMLWLESLVERKGYKKTITFKQLYKKRGIDLNIGATNLNKYENVFFNYIISPDLRIIRAIRMSIGIPLIFSAIKYKGDVYVDGGMINTYPIKMFENLDNVLGLKLVVNGEMITPLETKIETVDHYLYHVVHCFILQKERESTLSYKYADHTIFIDSNHITHTINFALDNDEKAKLIECGYNSTKKYFNLI